VYTAPGLDLKPKSPTKPKLAPPPTQTLKDATIIPAQVKSPEQSEPKTIVVAPPKPTPVPPAQVVVLTPSPKLVPPPTAPVMTQAPTPTPTPAPTQDSSWSISSWFTFRRKPAEPTAVPAGAVQVSQAGAPVGMASVLAARNATEMIAAPQGPNRVPIVVEMAPTGNAFSAPMPQEVVPAGYGMYPSRMPYGMPPSLPAPYGPLPCPPMPSYGPPLSMDGGTPNGLVNAFTAGGTTRPIPADFGSQPVVQGAFMPGQPAIPPTVPQAMMSWGMPGGMPVMPPQGPMMAPSQPQPMQAMPPQPVYGVEQVGYVESDLAAALRTLRESLLPSEREWAVERLAHYDWRAVPEVAAALTLAAREDPAPSVRATCVRALGKMKVNHPTVLETLRALKGDADPRVRKEVEQALPMLSAQ
jgi:hypothetical protein